MNAKHILWGAVLIGTAAGYVWSAVPSAAPSVAAPAASAATATVVASPPRSREEVEHSVYYPNCDAARGAGKAPILTGQPGYRSELDADGDGRACEPYRGG